MDENIIIASHHEAGHAVMAYIVGWNINSIELYIENKKLQYGVTNYDFNLDDKANHINLNRRVHALMGGPIAELFYRGENQINLDLLGEDGIKIDTLLKNNPDKENTIQTTLNQTATFLNLPICQNAINEISTELCASFNLSRDLFNEIITRHKVPQMDFR